MLDPEALARLRRFGDEVDRRTDALRAVYGVGSVALGDWVGHLSNLDVVAVAEGAWAPEVVARLRPAVRALAVRGRPARVAWVTWEDLATDPADSAGSGAPVVHGRRTVATGELVNPMTWHILRTAAVCVRGPEYPDVWSGDVRDWAEQRILEWWPAQVAAWERRPTSLWWRRQTCGPVLEVARLSVLTASGRVVSKLEAGESLVDDGARTTIQRILKDSVGYRQGAHMSMYWGPFERKNDVIRWIRTVVTDHGGTP